MEAKLNKAVIDVLGDITDFHWQGDEYARGVCFGCPLEPHEGETFGCSGFSESGKASMDTGRKNIENLINKNRDPSNCGIIREIIERRSK